MVSVGDEGGALEAAAGTQSDVGGDLVADEAVVHAGAGLRLEPSAEPGQIAAAARSVLTEDSYRSAAERIAAEIREETTTDLAVAEIEALLATAPEREAVTA